MSAPLSLKGLKPTTYRMRPASGIEFIISIPCFINIIGEEKGFQRSIFLMERLAFNSGTMRNWISVCGLPWMVLLVCWHTFIIVSGFLNCCWMDVQMNGARMPFIMENCNWLGCWMDLYLDAMEEGILSAPAWTTDMAKSSTKYVWMESK